MSLWEEIFGKSAGLDEVREPYRWDALAQYNSEVARGLVHTEEWKKRMSEEQRRFYIEQYGIADPEPGRIYTHPPVKRG